MAKDDSIIKPVLKPGTYSDGQPLDRVHFLECKIILKGERFTSAKSFLEYGKIVRQAADANNVGFSDKGIVLKPEIREVRFLDTPDFRLYNNAFILRQRIPYEDGFPKGDPEVVFKFRHPDLQKAAELDVRPNIAGRYEIKFKVEALPLKDQLGGYRTLYSHNAQLGLSQTPEGDRESMASLVKTFPVLSHLKKSDTERVELVNQAVVEEVLQDLGVLDFGKGIEAKCDVGMWRTRGDHKPLVGEFSFHCKFKSSDDLHDKAVERARKFFIELQQIGREWVLLGLTKTAAVYRLNGNPPQSHE